MSRPAVTVVMPFAGDVAAARAAAAALRSLETEPGDELILVDNSGSAAAQAGGEPAITVLSAMLERSPAHARNAGAAAASGEWILFLDADTRPSAQLLAAYFTNPIAADVGAIAGEIRPAQPGRGVVSRYGSSRSFLDQRAHLAHPYRPRAAAANLLVRREAFERLGGFYEGVRAAEDTDFSWRLQQAGWRLELSLEAWVSHAYRSSLDELRRQWRGYAAGRAWLARRYDGFHPQPALARALRGGRRSSHARRADGARSPRAAFLALDAMLAVEELIGFALSNRPARQRSDEEEPARVVVLADAFPAAEDPLVELVATLEGARVQALRRPQRIDSGAMARMRIDYLEDDGAGARTVALIGLALKHPFRSMLDLVWRRSGHASLRALAPAVARLEQAPGARLLAVGPRGPRAVASRIARLAGRKLDELEGAPPRQRR